MGRKVFIAAFMAIFIITACTKQNDPDLLIGKWKLETAVQGIRELEFLEDGTVFFRIDENEVGPSNFVINDKDILYIDGPVGKIVGDEHKYRVSSDRLTLIYRDDTRLNFTRESD